MSTDLVGKWAFLIGLIIAVLAGLLQGAYTIPYATLILVVLGLIVGFLNIHTKNSEKFLIAIIALMAVGSMTVLAIPSLDVYLAAILSNFVGFVGAAGLVVAIKVILETGKK
mgnify:CR=1 FL=1